MVLHYLIPTAERIMYPRSENLEYMEPIGPQEIQNKLPRLIKGGGDSRQKATEELMKMLERRGY